MSSIALLLVMVGCFLNVVGSRWSFVIWLISNVYFARHNIRQREWIQAAVFVVMSVSCVVGWILWG